MGETAILIVEDEAIVARDLRQRLQGMGYTVAGMASRGEEAVQKADTLRPDLVLMDIHLASAMDGIQAAELIRKNCDIPVVYLTAYADEGTLARAKVTEPFGYILKPFEERELHTIIELGLYRHRSEVALRASEKRYRNLVDNSTGLIFTHDMDGILLSINPAGAHALDYESGELVGHNLCEFLAPADLASYIPYLQQINATGASEGVMRILTHNGEERAWLYRNVRLEEGGKPFVQGYASDITERRRAEQETRQAQRFLNQIIENIPHTIFVQDARDLRFVQWNKAGEALLGVAREQLIGKTDYELYPEERAVDLEKQARATLASGQMLDIPEETVQVSHKDRRVLHTKKIPILDASGQPVYLLGISEDITEYKKAEEQRQALEHKLQETQKLESLGVLAGGIAHDFNNLLVSILGNVGLVLLDLDASSPVREPIEQIKIAAQRAADLTKQMLAYSGKGKFVMQPVNLNTIIREMSQLLRVSISKNTTLKFNLAQDLPLTDVDATQIRQIIMNLIVNGSDAIGNNPGVITISTGSHYADRHYLSETFMAPELKEGSYVYLEVADTGSGMDEETKKKIFDPFFTTKFTGRGLGLAAVLGILRGHEGAVKVYSEPGQGSVFRILLPCKDHMAVPQQQATSAPLQGQGTILVIDDEEVVRMVTRRMLERFGYTPLIAEDGPAGLELLKGHKEQVDCVLLDMTMPRMSGEETYREIIKIKPDARVLLMSGYTEMEANRRFRGEGLVGFMQKPYTPEDLQERLTAALAPKKAV